MATNSSYFWSGLALLLIAGAILSALDRRFGVRLRQGFWRWTHGEEEAADAPKQGFIHGRSAKQKFTAAVILWAMLTFVGIRWTEVNAIFLVVMGFVEVPVLLLGFYLSRFVDRSWSSMDTVFDTVDKLESGEIDLADTLRQKSREVGGSMRNAFRSPGPAATATPVATPEPRASVASGETSQDQPPPKEPENPRAVLDRFTHKGRGANGRTS